MAIAAKEPYIQMFELRRHPFNIVMSRQYERIAENFFDIVSMHVTTRFLYVQRRSGLYGQINVYDLDKTEYGFMHAMLPT